MRGIMFSCVATQHHRPTAQQNSSAVHLPIISHLLRCDLRVSFHLSPKLQLFPCTVLGECARRPKRAAVGISILPDVVGPSLLQCLLVSPRYPDAPCGLWKESTWVTARSNALNLIRPMLSSTQVVGRCVGACVTSLSISTQGSVLQEQNQQIDRKPDRPTPG